MPDQGSCPTCGGKRKVPNLKWPPDYTPPSLPEFEKPCPDCGRGPAKDRKAERLEALLRDRVEALSQKAAVVTAQQPPPHQEQQEPNFTIAIPAADADAWKRSGAAFEMLTCRFEIAGDNDAVRAMDKWSERARRLERAIEERQQRPRPHQEQQEPLSPLAQALTDPRLSALDPFRNPLCSGVFLDGWAVQNAVRELLHHTEQQARADERQRVVGVLERRAKELSERFEASENDMERALLTARETETLYLRQRLGGEG